MWRTYSELLNLTQYLFLWHEIAFISSVEIKLHLLRIKTQNSLFQLNLYIFKEKIIYNRETIRGIMISRLAKIPSTLSWLADILKLNNVLLFEFHRREGGFERHLLIYSILRGVCFVGIKYLLFQVLRSNYMENYLYKPLYSG